MYRLRFVFTLLKCFIQPTKELLDEFSVSFVVVPLLDTDFSRLFTQTYSQYMALSRWNFVFNSKLRNVAVKNAWVPVTTSETIVYKRSIKAFSKVVVKTKMIHWNDKRFYLKQTFLVNGEVHAFCYLEGLIRSPRGILEPPQVFRQLGVMQESPPAPSEIEKFIN